MKLFKLFKKRSKDDMCEASWYHIKAVAFDIKHAAGLVANSSLARTQLVKEIEDLRNYPDPFHVQNLSVVLAMADAEIASSAIGKVLKDA